MRFIGMEPENSVLNVPAQKTLNYSAKTTSTINVCTTNYFEKEIHFHFHEAEEDKMMFYELPLMCQAGLVDFWIELHRIGSFPGNDNLRAFETQTPPLY